MECRFRPTAHAKQRLAERGISRQEAMEALLRGARTRQGLRVVSRRLGLRIVWRKRPCRYHVITAMWEGP